MEDEIKIINERKKKKTIDANYVNFDFKTAYEDSSLLIVAERKEPLIIEEKQSDQTASTNEATEQIEQKVEALMAEEIAAGYIFAEEIDDDDDDIYRTDSIDQALMRDKHRSFSEIAEEIDSSIKSHGLNGRIGLPLLSMMQFSRIGRTTMNKIEASILFQAISNPKFIIEKGEESIITSNSMILDILSESKSHLDRPLFVYVTNIKPSEVMAYFKPFYDYIDNPDGENYILIGNKTSLISRNIYFLFNPTEDEEITLIPRKLLRYVSKVDVLFKEIEESDPRPCYISLSQLKITISDYNSYQFSEDSWKKIDRLTDSIGQVNGYILQNKIINRLENAATVYLASDYLEDEVLDIIISSNIITEAIVTKDKTAFEKSGLLDVLDTYFGADKMSLTRNIIKSYMTPIEKKGGDNQ